MTLWPWVALSVAIHGLVFTLLIVSWSDHEAAYSDGFVSIELMHAMREPVIKSNTDSERASHQEIVSKPIAKAESQIESIEKSDRKAENASVISVAASIPTNNLETKQQLQSEKRWSRVRSQLEKNKWYPASARRRGIEGDVELEFSLNEQGYAKHTTVVNGSGYASLDQAALTTVKRAEPFPADGGEYQFKLRFRRL